MESEIASTYPSCNSNTRRLNTCGHFIGCIKGGSIEPHSAYGPVEYTLNMIPVV